LADVGLAGAVEVQDAGDRLVEQLEVVADHHQAAAVGAQERQQPVAGVVVEVVGRLVEQEELAAGEEDAGQLDAAPLAAGQHAEGEVGAVGTQAEAGEQAAGLGLGGVAALVLEGVVGPAPAGHEGLVARRLLHPDPQLLHPVGQLVEPAAAEDVAERGPLRRHLVDAGVLGQVAEGGRAPHDTGLGLGVAADGPQEAGLAGAVAADKADLVAGAHGEGRPLDDEGGADLDRQPTNRQHGRPWWQAAPPKRSSVTAPSSRRRRR
jgi:hypothetical protein